MIPQALAIGIGPSQTKISFEPELETIKSINIFNNDKIDFVADITISGEMANFLSLQENMISFSSSDDKKELPIIISLPKDLPPGIHIGKIEIQQRPISSSGTLTTLLTITHDVIIEVPKHGKYLKETITQNNQDVKITIKNIGLKEIKQLDVTNTFSNSSETIVFTNSKNNFLSEEEFIIPINLNLSDGVYKHDLTIFYDELNKTYSKNIMIGKITAKIENITFEKFELGKINPINVLVSSNWNQELNLKIEAEVVSNGEIIQTISSSNFIIKDSASTIIFWDTTNLKAGQYEISFKIIYEEEVLSTEKYDFVLDKEVISFAKKKQFNYNILLIAIILVIISVLLFFVKSTKKKGKKKKNLYTRISKK